MVVLLQFKFRTDQLPEPFLGWLSNLFIIVSTCMHHVCHHLRHLVVLLIFLLASGESFGAAEIEVAILEDLDNSLETEREVLQNGREEWSRGFALFQTCPVKSFSIEVFISKCRYFSSEMDSLRQELQAGPRLTLPTGTLERFIDFERSLASLWLSFSRMLLQGGDGVSSVEFVGDVEVALMDVGSTTPLGPYAWELRKRVIRDYIAAFKRLADRRSRLQNYANRLLEVESKILGIEGKKGVGHDIVSAAVRELMELKQEEPGSECFRSIMQSLEKKLPKTSSKKRGGFNIPYL